MNLSMNGLSSVDTQLARELRHEIPIYVQIGEASDLILVGSINPHQADPVEPASMILSHFFHKVSEQLAEGLPGE